MNSPLSYKSRSGLPRLAWCARLTKEGCSVVHGPWVETRPEGFVEGVWDADFSEFDFDRAPNFFGSGGRCRGDRIVFVTATHQIDRLYLQERDGTILVSNSPAFLLAEADDAPDLGHSDYFFDLLRHHREGVSMGTCSLPTARGNPIRLYACCNIVIDQQLRVSAEEKPRGPEPQDYPTYRALLQGAVDRVFRNGADPARRHAYEPIAAVSLGYDSPAAATIAAQAGCRRALSYRESNSSQGMIDDHGGPIAEALGLEVHTLDRADFQNLPVEHQAETYLSPAAAADRAMGAAEDLMEGSLLVTGRRGETAWGRARRGRVTGLRGTFDQILPGVESIEQRLRFGYIQVHPAYVAALHGPSIYRINNSPELDSWVLGQSYDRPTARRIAEEGGVPRQLFGNGKAGGGGPLPRLGPEARLAFDEFYRSQVPTRIQRRLRNANGKLRRKLHNYLVRARLRFAARPFYERLLDVIQIDRAHFLWKMRELYIFHWGLLRTMERYRR